VTADDEQLDAEREPQPSADVRRFADQLERAQRAGLI
jgi:hypothetical protein